MADTGRQDVYSAELQFRRILKTPGALIEIVGTTIVTPDERKFGRVEDIQSYVDKVLDYVGHPVPVTIRERKGHTYAHYDHGSLTIAVPDNLWALRESVVLHELAHHMSPETGHGPAFRSTFTDLVEQVMGPEARFLLQHEFFMRGLTG